MSLQSIMVCDAMHALEHSTHNRDEGARGSEFEPGAGPVGRHWDEATHSFRSSGLFGFSSVY